MNSAIEHLPAEPLTTSDAGPSFIELSRVQRDMLLRQDLLGQAVYTIGMAMHLDGPLDVALLARATIDVVVAELMLRAVLDRGGDMPRWRVGAVPASALEVIDLRQFAGDLRVQAQAHIEQARVQGLDATLAPPCRYILLRLSDTRHVWMHLYNHILLDGWGVQRVGRRLVDRYEALLEGQGTALAPGPVYRLHERELTYLASPRCARDQAYWEQALPALPGAAARPLQPVADLLPRLVHQRWNVSRGAWTAYLQTVATHSASPAQAATALLAVFVARIAAKSEVVLGLPTHNRLSAEERNTVGLYASTLPLVLQTAASTRFIELLHAVASGSAAALKHQQHPTAALLARRGADVGIPGMAFDLMVSVEPFDLTGSLGLAHYTIEPTSGHPALAPIAAYVRDYLPEAELPVDLTIDPRLNLQLADATSLARELDTLLATLTSRPDATIAALTTAPWPRRELPSCATEPIHRTAPQERHEPPADPLQHRIHAMWRDVLGSDGFGVRDDFFALGGHSLHLTQVRSRIAADFGAELPWTELFDRRTIEQQAQWVAKQGNVAQAPTVSLARADRHKPQPASISQRRMWVVQSMDPQSRAYNMLMSMRLRGPLRPDALRDAIVHLVDRHEALRTALVADAGEPMQLVQQSIDLDWQDLDLAGALDSAASARALLREHAAQPFNLGQAPLHRLVFGKLGPDDHVLLWVLHHTVCDNWSFAILLRELRQLIGDATGPDTGAVLEPLRTGYLDFAAWQHSAQATAARHDQIAYWTSTLRDAKPLNLPRDFPRPALPSFSGSRVSSDFDPSTIAAIQRTSETFGTTPFVLMLSAWMVLLAKLCDTTDVTVGTPIANRHHPGCEGLVGTLVNTLAMRASLGDDPTFSALVQRMHRIALQAHANQDAPYDEVVDVLAPSGDGRREFVNVMFNMINTPLQNAPTGELDITEFDIGRVAAQFDLKLDVDFAHSGRIHLEYATDLIAEATAQRWLDAYLHLLRQAIAQPHRRCFELDTLPPGDLDQLQRWNATRQAPAAATSLPALIADAVRAAGGTARVRDASGQVWTHAELLAQADAIARGLQARGIGRGSRIGLCMPRGLGMLAGLLGILQAGACHVPLDPEFPQARLQFMASDAGLACILISDPAGAMAFGPDTLVPHWLAREIHDNTPNAALPRPPIDPGDPAYLIYTSGSTGQPKGVVVPHGAVVNFLTSMAQAPGLAAGRRLLAVNTLAFDISVLELLLPLLNGADLVIADSDSVRDAAALRRLLEASGANTMQATPATWRMLLDTGWTAPDGFLALVGGEALQPDLAHKLLGAGAELWNLYGPTETTVWSTHGRITDAQAAIRIGTPIANTSVWVLDARGVPCPIGVPGEIHIGGDGVATGYWKRPELTAERFVIDCFGGQPGARLYKTGDLGRWCHDGQLEHLGRLDQQVKVRGYRVELGEIEAALLACPTVAQAAVTTQTDAADSSRLVACLVAEQGRTLDVAAVRGRLRATLPAYMVPSLFLQVDALPRLPNGKIDRAKLPGATTELPMPTTDTCPDTSRTTQRLSAAEQSIAALWSELLGVHGITASDNFFDLGGHSLLAARAAVLMEKRLGLLVHPRRLILESLSQIAHGMQPGG